MKIFSVIHPDSHHGMDGYKEEGVGERCHIIIGDEDVNAGKDICLDAEAAEEDGERLAHHIEEEWVHAKGEQSLRSEMLSSAASPLAVICLS